MCEKVEPPKCIFCQLTERSDAFIKEFKSSETAKHLHGVGREFLLAIQSFVDETICRKERNK